MDTNIGGAGGFHVGFKEASYQTDADWLVCYDDDAYPQSGSIEQFKMLSFEKNVGSAATAVYLPNHTISEMNRPSFNPFWNLKSFVKTAFGGRGGFHIHDEDYASDKIIDIDASSFVGYFIKTDVVRKVGLPRQELFIYADDIIYALSIRKAGYLHQFLPNISFIHDCSTLVNNEDVYKPMWRVYYTYRNRLEMYRYTSGILFYPIALLKIFSWTKKANYYEDKPLYKKVMWLAVRDGLKRDFTKSHQQIIAMAE